MDEYLNYCRTSTIAEFEKTKNQLNEFEFVSNFEFDNQYFGKLKPICEKQVLISCSLDKTIKIWDLETKLCINTLKSHKECVKCIETIFDNKLMSGSDDKSLKIWNLLSGECIMTLYGHTDKIASLKKLSNSLIASGSMEIKIWNYHTGACHATFCNGSVFINCLELLSNGNLVAGTFNGILKYGI